jgi:large subunit ribosomal protein L18
MSKLFLNKNSKRRKLRIRETLSGSSERPRLSVFRSNKYIYGQIVDDVNGKTIVSVSTKELDSKTPKLDSSLAAGIELAKRASEKGIKAVVFDRNGYIYHGRVQKFAEGSRQGGLEF